MVSVKALVTEEATEKSWVLFDSKNENSHLIEMDHSWRRLVLQK